MNLFLTLFECRLLVLNQFFLCVLLCITPYKHFLNPIENYFNELKYYIKQKQSMNYNKIKESIEYGIKNIKKEHYENYFYNAYDKNKLKAKTENLNNRLHKKLKIYKD